MADTSLPLLDGKFGDLMDRINNKLQVVVAYTEGTPAEKAALEIATHLREIYNEINRCPRCKVGIDDDGDGNCKLCAAKTDEEASRIRDDMAPTYMLIVSGHFTPCEIKRELASALGIHVKQVDKL